MERLLPAVIPGDDAYAALLQTMLKECPALYNQLYLYRGAHMGGELVQLIKDLADQHSTQSEFRVFAVTSVANAVVMRRLMMRPETVMQLGHMAKQLKAEKQGTLADK